MSVAVGSALFLEHLVAGDVPEPPAGSGRPVRNGRRAVLPGFNPAAQRQNDPAGDYLRRWVPELADVELAGADIHALKEGRPAGYPEPIVDHAAERADALRRYGQIG